MRKERIHFLRYNCAYIVIFLCFQEDPSDFDGKDSSQRNLRKNRSQNKVMRANGAGQKEARPCTHAVHDHAGDSRNSNVARGDRAMWHDRATLVLRD